MTDRVELITRDIRTGEVITRKVHNIEAVAGVVQTDDGMEIHQWNGRVEKFPGEKFGDLQRVIENKKYQ